LEINDWREEIVPALELPAFRCCVGRNQER